MLFKKSKPKPFWYTNPWGMNGDLFGSAIIVLSLASAHQVNWLTEPLYVIFISVLILFWGFMNSKTMSMLNNVLAQRDDVMDLMCSQHKCIALSAVMHEAQDEVISQQKRKITLLEMEIKKLTHE